MATSSAIGILHNDGTNIYTSAIVKEICHYSVENNSFAL